MALTPCSTLFFPWLFHSYTFYNKPINESSLQGCHSTPQAVSPQARPGQPECQDAVAAPGLPQPAGPSGHPRHHTSLRWLRWPAKPPGTHSVRRGCSYTRPLLHDGERELFCLIHRNKHKVKQNEKTKEYIPLKEQGKTLVKSR